MLKLLNVVKQVLKEVEDKTILTSNPKPQELQKFHETTQRLMKILSKSKVVEKEILYNKNKYNDNNNMFTPSVIDKGNIVQHIGGYNGNDFKNFTLKIAEMYEKAGFKVERGYGIDDVKGFDIIGEDGEVTGEVDFLIKDSLPNLGDTVIIKHKK